MLGHIQRHFVETIQPQIEGGSLFALYTGSLITHFHSLYHYTNQCPHNSLFLKLYSECFHSNICRPLPWCSPLLCVFFLGWEGLFSTEELGDEALQISHGLERSGFGAYV